MTKEEFEMEMEKSFIRSKRLLAKKGDEYTIDNDRLGHFYRAGLAQSTNPTEALIGMATKHYISICDMVKNPFNYSISKWNAKLTDLRNYTILLDALIRDLPKQEVSNAEC